MSDTAEPARPEWARSLLAFDPPESPAAGDDGAAVDAVEAVALGGVLLVATVAVVSLVGAHLGVHSLPMVGLTTAAVVIAAAAVIVRWSPLPITRPGRSAALVLPALLVGALLFFPGFRYATGDKDPGIYVLHASSIAATGEITLAEPPLQHAGAFDDASGRSMGEWAGFVWDWSDTEVLPSFYHLWPAFMATWFDAMGFGALSVLNPLLGLLCLLLAFAVGRRLAGPLVGGAAALLLATNMMQVWQARYPTAEVLAQSLFLGAALALTVALHTARTPYAVGGGLLVSVGFLARGEGVALVLLAAAAASLAIGLQCRQRLALWFAVGLAVPLPFALYQAYDVAAVYSSRNDVPSFRLVAALLVLAAGFAVLGRATTLGAVVRRIAVAAQQRLDARGVSAARWVRWACTAVAVGLFLVAVVRPWFGDDYFLYGTDSIRSYDERSLHRLAWFFSWPGMMLALVGLLWVIWSRWNAARVLVVGASLVFLVLFLFHASNSPYLMWWGRRFIPAAVPGVALLIAMSLAPLSTFAIRRAAPSPSVQRRAAFATVVLVAICGYQFSQSVALRGHDEKAGSYGVALLVAGAAEGERGVFLWERGPCCAAAYLLFGSSTWVLGGVESATLPVDPVEYPEYLRQVTAAAPEQPVFVVMSALSALPDAPGIEFAEVRRITGSLPVWEEQWDRRPDRAIAYDFDMVVYRVTVA